MYIEHLINFGGKTVTALHGSSTCKKSKQENPQPQYSSKMESKRHFSSNFSVEESWCLHAVGTGTYTIFVHYWKKKKSERSNSAIKYGSPPLAPDCVAVCFIVLFHFHLSGLWLMWPWFYCAVVRNKTKASLIYQDLPPVGSLCTCMYMCVYRWSKPTCSRLTECAKLCKTADILLIFSSCTQWYHQQAEGNWNSVFAVP